MNVIIDNNEISIDGNDIFQDTYLLHHLSPLEGFFFQLSKSEVTGSYKLKRFNREAIRRTLNFAEDKF